MHPEDSRNFYNKNTNLNIYILKHISDNLFYIYSFVVKYNFFLCQTGVSLINSPDLRCEQKSASRLRVLRYANKLQTLQINIPLNQFYRITRGTNDRAAGQSFASFIPQSSVMLIARFEQFEIDETWERYRTLEAEEHN